MLVSLMIRLLLLTLLAFAVSSQLMDVADDFAALEELEDLILRDENMKAYSKPAEKRTAYGLLNQFNSAVQSPASRNKLIRFLRELQRGQSFTRMLSKDDIQKRIAEIYTTLGLPRPTAVCPTTTPEYRTMDGTCNNLENPEQGSVRTPLKRVLSNAYDDKLSQPRTTSVNKRPLPGSREVASKAFGTSRGMNADYVSLTAHFGQLLDHDVTQVQNQVGDCSGCSAEGECFSIIVDESDRVFGGIQQCFTFHRSKFQIDSDGVRQQTNFITSYLDASFVYGSDHMNADRLRNADGSLKHLTDKVTGRELLPPDKDLPFCAGVDEEANIYCGLAGESRAAEQPGLTAMHVLFLREHNRIAKQLRTLDPSLSGDEIYQKARKILGAEWQHIVYNEYVPLMVGEELYQSKKLDPGARYKYKPTADASISNLFAAAAFRVGHTQVPFEIVRGDKNFKKDVLPKIEIGEAFFNATYMFDETIPDGAVDAILRGMASDRSYVVDRLFSDALRNNLFGDPKRAKDGFDLPSLNIQRARDHGLPSYTKIRKRFCRLGEINSFDDLEVNDIMTPENVQSLIEIYGDDGVEDVDAYVGLLLETLLPNTLVGPTLACILADQFHRLKFGDRFFYQNLDHFTRDQIDEIEKATLARLICDNVEAISKMQPYTFIKPRLFTTSSAAPQKRDGLYKSFYEYSRSGTWPHSRATIGDGLDNRRQHCTSDMIPVVDLTKFI